MNKQKQNLKAFDTFGTVLLSLSTFIQVNRSPFLFHCLFLIIVGFPFLSVLFCSVLCCAVLCCLVQCCVVLCCAVPCCCCAVLCCVVLFSVVLCCAVLCCAVLCIAVPCSAVLCCIVLCFVVLRCVALCCAVLYCALLRCAVFCCVVLGQGAELCCVVFCVVERVKMCYSFALRCVVFCSVGLCSAIVLLFISALCCVALCILVLYWVELRCSMVLCFLCYIVRRNWLILTQDRFHDNSALQQGSNPMAHCTTLPGPSCSGNWWLYSCIESKNSYGNSERKTLKEREKKHIKIYKPPQCQIACLHPNVKTRALLIQYNYFLQYSLELNKFWKTVFFYCMLICSSEGG